VLAWRSWILNVERGAFLETDFFLHSWRGTRWDGPTLVADALPTLENSSGIYARPLNWKTNPWMLPDIHITVVKVRGMVALTGRVIEGADGYRAERGTVRELWCYGAPGNALDFDLQSILEQRYACPVHIGKEPPFEKWIYL